MGGCLEGDTGPLSFETWKTVQKVCAEFLATTLFVLCGVASCINWTHESDPDQLIRIALTIGLGLTALIYMFGPISGCHVNPAVTSAMIVAGRTKIYVGILYMIAQCVGAITGAGLLWLMQTEDYKGAKAHLFGVTQLNPNLAVHEGLLVEIMATFILIIVVLLLTDPKWIEFTSVGGIGIGFTLVVLELAFVNATGGSMNPARSLGPACIANHYSQLWIYWLGPIAGGLLAVGVYKTITWEPKGEHAEEINEQSTFEGGGDYDESMVVSSIDVINVEDPTMHYNSASSSK